MGIRIHKVLGYGLTDVTGPDDHRFTKNIFDLMNDIDRIPREKLYKEIRKHEDGMGDRSLLTSWRSKDEFLKKQMIDFITYDDEYGENNVCIFSIITNTGWYRHDDIIDYCEFGNRGMENTYKVLRTGIWPHISWMDSRNGHKFGSISMVIDILDRMEKDEWTHIPGDLEYQTKGYFKDAKDVRDFLKPSIPPEISILSRIFGAFKSDTTLLQLRPILYTYWE